jgi:DNA repair exonuclease SbcCD ATPase subunit
MLDAIKPLIDNGVINEDTQAAITEAWESQINEAREQVRAELREEFAGRYDHDKSVMVEALDKLVTEGLESELKEFAEEKQALAEDRVKFKRHMTESASKFNNFLVKKLSKEISELHEDRKTQNEATAKLEKFVIRALAEEIKEFEQDKKAVVETKVKLVAEAKKKLAKLQETFVKRSATLVKDSVKKNLGAELAQLKEDVQVARENMFGRRLFEAFASEFAVTHLSENKEFEKLQAKISNTEKKLAESTKANDKSKALIESKNREVRIIKDKVNRKETMSKLLENLNAEKAEVMGSLLESTQTGKLQAAYEKYLPAVLSNTSVDKPKRKAKALNEGRKVVSGNKSAKKAERVDTNVVDIKRLAGL